MMNPRFGAALLGVTALVLSTPALADGKSQAPPPVAPTSIILPTEAGAGAGKDVKQVLDNPMLSLATIVLRKGTVLPEHSSRMPVTILSLKGSGTVMVGGKKLRLDPGNMVFLPPGAPHAVQPDAGTDLVLLVHHMKPSGTSDAQHTDDHNDHDKDHHIEGAKP